MNNVNEVIEAKKLGFTGEIYKYDKSEEEFTNSAVFNFDFDYDVLSARYY